MRNYAIEDEKRRRLRKKSKDKVDQNTIQKKNSGIQYLAQMIKYYSEKKKNNSDSNNDKLLILKEANKDSKKPLLPSNI